MAKIVINIPDFLYKQILKKHVSKATIARVFQNGIVLPKRHGRLIDGDALKEKMLGTMRYFYIKYDIDEAPTIIEADNEFHSLCYECKRRKRWQ